MRVGVIGCGSIGRRHIGNLLALGCDVLAYDLDIQASRAARREHYRAEPRAERDDLLLCDAIVIASPLDTHLEHAEWAIANGLPLFVEKSLGTLSQLPRWRALTTSTLPVNQAGYNWRFHVQIRAWKEFLKGYDAEPNDLTKHRRVNMTCSTDMALWPGRAYGDPVLECSHDLDLALWMGAGRVTRAEYLTREPGCTVSLAGGFNVSLYWARETQYREYSIFQPCRQLVERVSCTHYGSCDPHEVNPLRIKDTIYVDQSYQREIEHFLGCVQSGTPTDCPLSDGLKALEVCQQIEALANQPA